MATRILAAWYFVGQDQGYPETNIYSWNLSDPRNKQVNVRDDHAKYVIPTHHTQALRLTYPLQYRARNRQAKYRPFEE
jgi:hypothetical protein